MRHVARPIINAHGRENMPQTGKVDGDFIKPKAAKVSEKTHKMDKFKMKKLDITHKQYSESRYLTKKYGKLAYVSESGKMFKTDKGTLIKFLGESKLVKEGGGAGYTITIDGLRVDKSTIEITNIKQNEKDDGEYLIEFTANITPGEYVASAEGYDMTYLPHSGNPDGMVWIDAGRIFGSMVFFTNRGIEDEDIENSVKEDLADEFDVETMYGRGWTHCYLPKDGKITLDVAIDADYAAIDKIELDSEDMAQSINFGYDNQMSDDYADDEPISESSNIPLDLRQAALKAQRLLKDKSILGDKELEEFANRARKLRREELAKAAEDILAYREAAKGLTDDRENGSFTGEPDEFEESSEEFEESGWFDSIGQLTKELPDDCILDCSHQGACDADVSYWVDELGFEVPSEKAKAYLKGFGAWDDDELDEMTDRELAEKVLWIFCGYLKDDPDYYPSLDA